jgi:solute carrier family 7 (L-type amino acid transporter), member 5
MSDNNNNVVSLKKNITLFSACAIIIGNIVGSGIYISSTGVLEYAGSPGVALIIWALSGLISLVGAYCYTELGTLIQTSGGDYAYINKAYGQCLSFLYSYMMIFVTIPTLNAIFGMTVALYSINIFYSSCDMDSMKAECEKESCFYDNIIRIISALTVCKFVLLIFIISEEY